MYSCRVVSLTDSCIRVSNCQVYPRYLLKAVPANYLLHITYSTAERANYLLHVTYSTAERWNGRSIGCRAYKCCFHAALGLWLQIDSRSFCVMCIMYHQIIKKVRLRLHICLFCFQNLSFLAICLTRRKLGLIILIRLRYIYCL